MNSILEQINSMGAAFVQFGLPVLVQSSVLIVILLSVNFLLRNRVRAVFRYWLWMLVLVKLVLPPGLSSPVSVGHLLAGQLQSVKAVAIITDTAEVDAPQPEELAFVEVGGTTPLPAMAEPAVAEADSLPAKPVVSAAPVTWQGALFLVWLAIVAAMMLLLLQRAMFVYGLVAQAKKTDGLMVDTFRSCCERMRVKGKVGLKVSANAASPAVCGLFRPVILLPQNLGPNMGPGHLQAVLLHELAHIKRGDLWVNLAQTLLQIFYFYNPLLWLANVVIRATREQAVDESVQVAMGERARQYPQALVDVAKLALERPALSLRLIGVVESKSLLKERVKRMLSRPIPKSAKLGFVGLIAIIITAVVLLPMAKAMSKPPALVIKGVVADAESGQPIAGAKVFDDGYGPEPKWEEIKPNQRSEWGAITNSAGEYSFLTWPEHHTIKSEAPGYEPKRESLYSGHFTLNKKDKEVFDFSLKPMVTSQESNFSVTLPNGVTVELVGVCEYPDQKRGWSAAGNEIRTIPWRLRDYDLETPENRQHYAFVAQISGSTAPSTHWHVQGGWETAYLRTVNDSSGNKLEGIDAFAAALPEDRKKTVVGIGVAAVPWETISTIKEKQGVSIGFCKGGEYTIQQPIEHPGGRSSDVKMVDTIDRSNYALRMVAVTNSGETITSAVNSTGGSHLTTTSHRYMLPLKQIKEFQLQTRPYEWVEFKNVSLKPNFKTAVQVEGEGKNGVQMNAGSIIVKGLVYSDGTGDVIEIEQVKPGARKTESETQEPAVQVEMEEGWGRVEGQLFVGEKAEKNESIRLYPFDVNGYPKSGHEFRTTTGTKGNFVFEKVPVGWASVGRLICISPPPLENTSYSPSYSVTNRTQVEIKPGQISRVTLGGSGRPVEGKFIMPTEYKELLDFGYGARALTTLWDKSDDLKWRNAEYKQYVFMINQDGTFRIEDVPAGKYKLYVSIESNPYEGELKDIAYFNEVIEVPDIEGNRRDEPYDLGTLELKLSASKSGINPAVQVEGEDGKDKWQQWEEQMSQWGEEFGEKYGEQMEQWGQQFGEQWEDWGQQMEEWGRQMQEWQEKRRSSMPVMPQMPITPQTPMMPRIPQVPVMPPLAAQEPAVQVEGDEKSIAGNSKVEIGGIVQDKGGQAIRGVEVDVTWDVQRAMPMLDSEETVTDEKGKWKCEIPDNIKEVGLTLEHEEFVKQTLHKINVWRLDGDFATVMKKGFELRGKVTDSNGSPIVDALLMPPDSVRSISAHGDIAVTPTMTQTESDGSFMLSGLSPGENEIVVDAKGFAAKLVTEHIQAKNEPLTVILDKGNTLTGRIVDANEAPIEEAKIKSYRWKLPREDRPDVNVCSTHKQYHLLRLGAESGKDGSFKIENVPSQGILDVYVSGLRDKGFLTASADVNVSENTPIEITLYKPPVIEATVTDEQTGKPIQEFEITEGVKWHNSKNVSWLLRSETIKSAEGKFKAAPSRFISSEPQPYGAIKILAQGYLPATVLRKVGEKSEPIVVGLRKADPISGKIVDRNREPIEQAEVAWVGPERKAHIRNSHLDGVGAYVNGPEYIARSGVSGFFELPASSKEGEIVAVHEKGYAQQSADKSGSIGELVLIPWSKIHGQLLGFQAEEKSIRIDLVPQSLSDLRNLKIQWMTTNVSDSDGAFDFKYVPSIPMTLSVRLQNRWIRSNNVFTPEPGQNYKMAVKDGNDHVIISLE